MVKALDTLDAVPLAQLVKLTLRKVPVSSRSCETKCVDSTAQNANDVRRLCGGCKDAVLLYRAVAAYELERSLLEQGWGYGHA